MKVNHRIHLCLAKMSDNGMEQKYILEAFQTNWVAPLGPNVDAFERDLEDYLNEIPHHPSTGSGTSGLPTGSGTARDEGFDSNFWLTTILFGQNLDTEALCLELDKAGIEARPSGNRCTSSRSTKTPLPTQTESPKNSTKPASASHPAPGSPTTTYNS